jgi:hypothetical protein
MGGECGTNGCEERSYTGFWWGDLRERKHLEDVGVCRRMMLVDLKEMSWEGVDWNNLAHDSFKWWALVITAMNRWVLHCLGNCYPLTNDCAPCCWLISADTKFEVMRCVASVRTVDLAMFCEVKGESGSSYMTWIIMAVRLAVERHIIRGR